MPIHNENGKYVWRRGEYKTWQGLTDDEKKQLHKEHHLYIPTIEKIEAILKEKNNG